MCSQNCPRRFLFHSSSTSLSGMGTSKVWFTVSTPHTVGWPMFSHRLIKVFHVVQGKGHAESRQEDSTAWNQLLPFKIFSVWHAALYQPTELKLACVGELFSLGDLKLDIEGLEHASNPIHLLRLHENRLTFNVFIA